MVLLLVFDIKIEIVEVLFNNVKKFLIILILKYMELEFMILSLF